MLILLGLILLCGSGAFAGLLIAYNLGGGPDYTATIFGVSLPTLNTLGVFCTGIALGLIFCFGLWLIGLSRRVWVRRRVRTGTVGRGPMEDAGHPVV